MNIKIWIKIENFLNKLLTSIINVVKSSFNKFYLKFFHPLLNKVLPSETQNKISSKFVKTSLKSRELINSLKDTTSLLEKIKNTFFGTLTKIQERTSKKKDEKNKKNEKFEFKVFVKKTKDKIKKLTNPEFLINASKKLSFLSLLLVGFYFIYQSTDQIWLKQNRSPASDEAYQEKSPYYQLDKKTSIMLNLKIPLFYKDKSDITTVTIDFSVNCSNKFTCLFLTERDVKAKDYIIQYLEPTPSQEVFSFEGRQILLEKIKNELNNFLQENRIQGEIIQVGVVYIMGT